ncbi:hypothetical protein OH77DRAFT_1519277 [Trametes cingulata]|nr:hypothetical protein OH77DRAFT_1519277 [Trametes cingulata]
MSSSSSAQRASSPADTASLAASSTSQPSQTSSPSLSQGRSDASSSSLPSTSSTSRADPPPSAASDTTSAGTTASPTDPPTSPPPDTSTTPTPTPTPPTSAGSDTSTPPPDSSTTNPPPTGSGSGSGSDSNTSPPVTSGSSSAGSSAASSASASSTPSPSTSTQTQTVIATAPDGSVYTSVITSTLISTPTVPASDRSSSSSSSSHTGAIVGGVVGGVAGAALLATLLFFLCRARRRRDDFDGNFDPDRVTADARGGGTLPDIDLAADEITPYNYTPAGMNAVPGAPVGGAGPAAGGMQDMRQYGGQVPSFLAGGLAGAGAGAGAALAHDHHQHPQQQQPPPSQQGYARTGSPPSSYSGGPQPAQSSYYAPSSSDHGGYADYAAYAAYANPHANAYTAQGPGVPPPSGSAPSSPTNASFGPQTGVGMPPARDFRHPSPGPSLAATDPSVTGSGSGHSSGPGVIPSAKEREAMQYRRPGGLAVANPDGGPSGVVQHQDAGRLGLDATPEDEEPSEVPPRYDSIRHDA